MKSFPVLLAAVACFLLLACGGSPLTLTQANLDRVQSGMSEAQVKAILGSPTETKSEPIPVVGGTKTTCVYANEKDRVVLVFKNDNLQTKEGVFTSTTGTR